MLDGIGTGPQPHPGKLHRLRWTETNMVAESIEEIGRGTITAGFPLERIRMDMRG